MPELMTALDVKKTLRCSLSYVFKLSEGGRIPSIRIPCPSLGTRKKELVRFRREDIEAFINNHYRK
ncbi:MAG: hypothetical protein WCJ37_01775 [Syntrophus sp. (in: bacteria)]